MIVSFPPGFPNARNLFDPVAIVWAAVWGAIMAGIIEAIRYRMEIASMMPQKHVIAIAGGMVLAVAAIGLTMDLMMTTGFQYAFVWMILVSVGATASIIVQNHPRFNKPRAAPVQRNVIMF